MYFDDLSTPTSYQISRGWQIEHGLRRRISSSRYGPGWPMVGKAAACHVWGIAVPEEMLLRSENIDTGVESITYASTVDGKKMDDLPDAILEKPLSTTWV
ncbi:hypothetical protein LTR97_007752 [Elasticomyces elasticus]|uniref:Uncharacterized protein n=1 Tax=Elasticomyces elasticus TaxID=574655 RepID=A0AAN7W7H8_9PEZI|nr:hypothetical protein LTR97_007752 [Elasticomyces elasticus]